MSYLFGDSTASPFRINFVEFMRLALGFASHVLRVERRVLAERARSRTLEGAVETDRRRLQQLLATLTDVVRRDSDGAEPRVARCAENIEEKAVQLVEAGLQTLTATLTKDLVGIEQIIKLERTSSVEALEKVLLQYDLPEADNTLHLRLSDGRYGAWLESVTPYGLETVVELTIPPESGFVHDARVDRFVEGLELHAPETAGWIRKESKMTLHKVGRFYIVELDVGEAESSIKLRSSPEPHAVGYDIVFREDEPRPRMSKVGKDADGTGTFEVEETDIPNLLRFRDKLAEAARSLASRRKTLVSGQIAERPIQESEAMRDFIERLLLVLAPPVRDLSAHSLSPSELVLRRMIGDDRREEIFVTKAELRAKFSDLEEDDRRLFDVLDLGEPVGGGANPRRSKGAGNSTPPPDGVLQPQA
jgi:hypothetical protein